MDYLDEAQIWDPEVIRTSAEPLQAEAGIAVLHGNLAPSGAIIKPAAATPELLRHRGRAVVFDSIEDMHARIDDPDLDVDEDSVLVLRGCGPKGYPGMPEVSNMPLPAKLLAARRAGHGADLRRPDERHRLRHGGAARRAGGGGRGAAGPGPDRRLDHRWTCRPAGSTSRSPTRSCASAPRRGDDRRPGPARPGLGAPLRGPVGGADTGADLDFLVGSSGDQVARDSH